jgi:hypothetical protein
MPAVRNPHAAGDNGAADDAVAITTSDTAYFPVCRGIYVGVGGDVVVVTTQDNAVTFKNAASGTVLPVNCQRVNATNTTATNLIALY